MRKNQEGFSFIELLVVVVLIGIVGIILAQILILNVRSQNKSEILKEVKQSGDFALSTMEVMVRNAIDIPDTSCNTNAQSFSIINQDGFTTTFDCDEIRIASTSSDVTPPDQPVSLALTSTKVSVASCTFRVVCPTPALSPKYVFLNFTLQQARGDASVVDRAQESFQSTISLRNYQ